MKVRIVILLVIILSSCYGGFRYWRTKIDIPLEDQKENIAKLNLNTNGLWIDTVNNNLTLLYANGVFLNYGIRGKSLEDVLSDYNGNSNFKEIQKTICRVPYGWGVYNINGENIQMERWVSTSKLDKYRIIKFKGRIYKDSKMVVKMIENKKLPGTEDEQYNYTYFPIENKPDSCMRWFE